MASSVATLFEYVSYNLISPSKRDYYSEESKSLYLSEDTLRELVNINEKKQFLDIRRDTIKPLNCIGVVKAGSINIQIFPKLFKNDNSNLQKALIARNLLKMLSYTEKLSIREINSAELNSEEFDFFEIFIYLFAKKLNEQIKSTQRREYVKNSEEINFVRGRIDTKRYTNPARLHIIPCNFYQFSLDNTLNRTLKYTCYLMSKIVTNIEIFRLLKSIDAVMDSVSLVPITISEIDRISFNRLNQMFEPFIRTCRIFLSNSTLTLQASEIENFSLLIPMETLFEEFIFEVLNEDVQYFFGPDAIVCSQKNIGKLAKREDGSGVFNLLPDIVVNIGKEVAIIDTKYKSLILS